MEKFLRDTLSILPASAAEIFHLHRNKSILQWYAAAVGELSSHYDTARAALKAMLPADPPPDDDDDDEDTGDLVPVEVAAGMTS